MGDLLLELQRSTGIMVLLISHDSQEIGRLSGRVVSIDAGKIVFSGTSEDWVRLRKDARHNPSEA